MVLSFLMLVGVAAGADDTVDVYLLIGQSNMAGRAPITERKKGEMKNCLLLNNEDGWEPASNPLNRYSTIRKGLKMQRLGPGYMFAVKMAEQLSRAHPPAL
ncbi:hypothetical protein BVY04_05365 [bacterium M21]|nr:hypothetical protein BVY04_05365 [bacterium M21]